MLGWMQENAELLNVAMSLVLMCVWVTYLQFFLVSFMRQNRSVIHISRAASQHSKGRCLVTNMGATHTYLLAVAVDIDTEDGNTRSLVTDREEVAEGEFSDLLMRTLQGPLGPGEARDIGSFEELAQRAQTHLQTEFDIRRLNSMTITAVGAPNQQQSLVAAYKRFDVRDPADPDKARFLPETLLTKQFTGMFRTRRIARILDGY